MNKTHRVVGIAALAVVVLWSGMAAAQAEKSLNKCQDTVKKAGEKFIQGEVKAMGGCLKRIANNVIQDNAAITTSTAFACVKQFRKINDSRGLGKSLPERLSEKITEKCDPALNPHTIDDITGEGTPGVAEPIETTEIETWCKHFGGDGNIDTFTEWLNCVKAAQECQARQTIAVQYPRAPEWLDEVQPIMAALPPDPDDAALLTDAVAGADAAHDAIDSDGDGKPDIRCGGGGVTCGTGCCYVQNSVSPFQTSCFEYTAPEPQFSTMAGNCPGSSLPGGPGLQTRSWVGTGPCTSIGSVSCTGSNRVVIPKDSSCP